MSQPDQNLISNRAAVQPTTRVSRFINRGSVKTGIFLTLICLSALAIMYLPMWQSKYQVPPGDDAATHLIYINRILSSQSLSPKLVDQIYPLGFHIIVITLSKLTGLSPFNIILYGTPLLKILPILVIFIFARKFYGQRVALFAAMAIGILSNHPNMDIFDGGFPNVITSYFLLPLCWFTLASSWLSDKNLKSTSIVSVVFILAIALTSSFGFLITLITIVLGGLVMLIGTIIRHRWSLEKKWLMPIGIIAVGFGVSIAAIWPIYIKNVYLQLLNKSISQPSITDGASVLGYSTYDLSSYYIWLGPVFTVLALLGLAYLPRYIGTRRGHVAVYTLIIAAILFIISLTTYSVVPGRFVRILSLPLSLFAGIFIANYSKEFTNKAINTGVIIAVTVLLVFTSNVMYINAFTMPFKPNLPIRAVRIDSPSLIAINWLRDHTNPNTVILVGPSHNAYVEAITNRNIIYGGCQQVINPATQAIYNPASAASLKFFTDTKIEYVYITTRQKNIYIEGTAKNTACGWGMIPSLKKAGFLDVVYSTSDKGGTVEILRVNKQQLSQKVENI